MSSPLAERLQRIFHPNAGMSLSLKADVTLEGDIQRAVDSIVAAHGRLDFAFNNAGIASVGLPIGEVTEAIWEARDAVLVHDAHACSEPQRGVAVDEGGDRRDKAGPGGAS